MTYSEWGDEYLDDALMLKNRIKEIKTQLKSCKSKETKKLETRIGLLYDMYLDCVHVAVSLKRHRNDVKWN